MFNTRDRKIGTASVRANTNGNNFDANKTPAIESGKDKLPEKESPEDWKEKGEYICRTIRWAIIEIVILLLLILEIISFIKWKISG